MSKSGNFSLGFEEEERRRSTLGELILQVERMRDCGLDQDYAYDLCNPVCISIDTNASSCCMLDGTYRRVLRADKHMVIARKGGGCRFAAQTRDSKNALHLLPYRVAF